MSSTTTLERKVNCDSVKHQKDDWLCALSIFSVIAPPAAASSSEVVVVVKLKLKLKSGKRVVAAEDTCEGVGATDLYSASIWGALIWCVCIEGIEFGVQ